MTSTCSYIFKKGKNEGLHCPTNPRYGGFCAVHKKYDRDIKNIVSKILRKEPTFKLNKFGARFMINWNTRIIFENGKPVGKAISDNLNESFYPLIDSDITILKKWGIENEYTIDVERFKSMYYPKKLLCFMFPVTFGRARYYPYPFVVDESTNFAYKYNEVSNVFDFYGVLQGLAKDITSNVGPYVTKLLEVVNLRGIRPVHGLHIPNRTVEGEESDSDSDSEADEKEEKKEGKNNDQSFTLCYQVESRFFLYKEDKCSICYENRLLYYSAICDKPHPCCKDCWKSNKQNHCPFCRKILYR